MIEFIGSKMCFTILLQSLESSWCLLKTVDCIEVNFIFFSFYVVKRHNAYKIFSVDLLWNAQVLIGRYLKYFTDTAHSKGWTEDEIKAQWAKHIGISSYSELKSEMFSSKF